MKFYVVLSHPKSESLNRALFSTTCEALTLAGHEVTSTDLYAIGFNPVSYPSSGSSFSMDDAQMALYNAELRRELELLEWCDAVVFHFPLWWSGMPAMMRGWIDRVLGSHSLAFYRDHGGYSSKKSVMCITQAHQDYEDIMGHIIRPMEVASFQAARFNVLPSTVITVPPKGDPSADAATREALALWRKRCEHGFSEDPVPPMRL
jgi:NAD(P)H dehydrogenase (quinone)